MQTRLLQETKNMETKTPVSNSFFNRLPTAILKHYLLPYEDTKAMAQLCVTSRSGKFFQEHQIKSFLQAVVYAQYGEVQEILDDAAKHSLPLLKKILITPMEVVDYSGRHLYGTALQLALGAGDVSRPKFLLEGIAELIMSFYDKLPDGASLKKTHIEEFKKYSEITPEQNTKDLSVVEKIFRDIADAKADDDCEAALQIFRDYLKPNPKKLIKGKHFNHNMLIKAHELYAKYYEDFGGWCSHKNMLAWQKVIRDLERFLPACDAQVLCQGLFDVISKRQSLARLKEYRVRFSYERKDFHSLCELKMNILRDVLCLPCTHSDKCTLM